MAEMKDYKCVSCGCITQATKFASAPKVQCQDCKNKGLSPDPNIVAEVMSQSKPRTTTTVASSGDGKESICTVCGQPTIIGRFASHKTAICSTCKGTSSKGEFTEMKIDLSKIDRSKLPNIDDFYVLPTVIKNNNLRNVMCPACKSEDVMRIIRIIDGDKWGLVIMYQCPDCMAVVNISEQTKHRLKPTGASTMFSYSGEEIKALCDNREESQKESAIYYLLNLLEQNNITVDGIKIPAYINDHDKKAYDKALELIDRGFSDDILIEKPKEADQVEGN